eukprot:151758-Hanusia_phi.AAC.2
MQNESTPAQSPSPRHLHQLFVVHSRSVHANSILTLDVVFLKDAHQSCRKNSLHRMRRNMEELAYWKLKKSFDVSIICEQ